MMCLHFVRVFPFECGKNLSILFFTRKLFFFSLNTFFFYRSGGSFFFNRNFGQSSNFNPPIVSIQNIKTALQYFYFFFDSRVLRDGRLPNVVNL